MQYVNNLPVSIWLQHKRLLAGIYPLVIFGMTALTDILPNRPRRRATGKGLGVTGGTEVVSSSQLLYTGNCLIQEAVRTHHKQIVGLVHEKRLSEALKELLVMYTALLDPHVLRFREYPVGRLLNGCFDDSLDPSVVNSFHLLLLQTLIQHVSSNLLLVMAGENGLSVGIFDTIACSLKQTGSIAQWVQRAPSGIALKHYACIRKVSGGFVKIIDFLVLKSSHKDLQEYRNAWLLLQMKFSRLADPDFEISIPNGASGLFVADLRSAVGETLEEPILIEENTTPTERLQYVLDLLQIRIPTLQVTHDIYTMVVSKLLSLKPTTKSIDVLENFLLAFQHTEIIHERTYTDFLIRFSKEAASSSLFERLLLIIIPNALETFTDKNDLISICFRYVSENQNPASLLLALKFLPTSIKTTKKQSLRELTLTCLCEKGQLNGSLDIAIDFLKDHDFPKINIFEGISEPAAPVCVLNALIHAARTASKDLQISLKGVQLDDQRKSHLLLQAIETPDVGTKASIGNLFDALDINDSTIRLFCQLHIERLTAMTDILPKAATPFDSLLTAAIISNRLKSATGPVKPFLIEISDGLERWFQGSTFAEVEANVFTEAMYSLYHSGYFSSTMTFISSFSNMSSLSAEAQLPLHFLTLRCLLELGEFDKIPAELGIAGKLMKQMADAKISVESTSLVEWKLYQFDYFISTNNREKADAKFQEVTSFLLRKPEFSLENQGSLSLHQSISCLLLNANFLRLTAKLELDEGSFVLAFKNVKLAIKIGVSILRKLRKPCQNKSETVKLLLECYKHGFQLSRQIGALGEAWNMVAEMEKLNNSFDDCLVNAMHHFEIADMHFLVGDSESASSHLRYGLEKSNEKDMALLDAAKLRSLLLQNAFNSNEGYMDSTKRKLQVALEAVDCHDAFSLKLIASSFEVLQHLLSQEESAFILNKTEPSQRAILVNALVTARQEIKEVGTSLADAFNTLVIPSGLNFTKENNENEFDLINKLLDCKDTLLKFLQNNYSQKLGVEETRDLQDCLTRCVFTLSQITVVKSEGAESLLRDVIYLQDIPRHFPYKSVGTLYQDEQRANELLPVMKRNVMDNNEARDAFFEKINTRLPENYLIVTIDVCGESGDLVLSKIGRRSKSPALLRLSLARNSSGPMSFASVMAEIQEIINESHQTTSLEATSKVKTKEDRRNWWKKRFVLDARMKALLDNVEEKWIGGFKSLFELDTSSSTEYLFFKSELQRVWRRALGIEMLNFSDTITELYFNLTPCGNELLETGPLNDLIAYTASELGADINVKKMNTDLKKIYPARRKESDHQHLILVPSHACSEFPWESLSFLRSKSISRVPSVNILFDLLSQPPADLPSVHNRYYVLNPGGDLKKTELRFKSIFSEMPRTRGIAGHAPEEEELIQSLFKSDFFFYAGHGGGEQYMRMTQLVKKSFNENVKLPPAILMGCSSGALQKHGKLEPSSNIMTWLMCGSPMTVSNLWDITDKDIDAFSSQALQRWGLIGDLSERSNIARAVAESRDTCVLKYLNGAAPIVHGLPIRIE